MRQLGEMTDAEVQIEHARVVERLRKGAVALDGARDRGDEAFLARWEPLWIELLRQYEEIYDSMSQPWHTD